MITLKTGRLGDGMSLVLKRSKLDLTGIPRALVKPYQCRRDCMGIPLSVGDFVTLVDDTRVEVLGFVDGGQLIYASSLSPLSLSIHPCAAVVLSNV